MSFFRLISDRCGSEFKYLGFLFFVWFLCFWVVGGIADFPLNDDWSYGITTKRLIETGNYHPVDWTSMSLISQVFFGALFCFPFGFSFTALHISTFVLSFFGIVSIYKICRMLNASCLLSVFISLVVMLNPIYLVLSGTFMTDIPFLSFVSMSMFFLIRSLKFRNFYSLLGGTFFLVLAVLCRQNALFLGVAFFISFLVKFSFGKRNIGWAIMPLLAASFFLFLYNRWLHTSGLTPALYGKQIFQLTDVIKNYSALPRQILQNGFNAVIYVGLFLFPVLVLAGNKVLQNKNLRIVFFVVLFCIATKYIVSGSTISLWGNILVKEGLGPLTLHDGTNLKLSNISPLQDIFWIGVTIIAVTSTSLLITLVIGFFLKIKLLLRHEWFVYTIFFVLASLVYIGPLLLLGFFDRYLLPPFLLIAFALIPILDTINQTRRRVAISIFGCYALFSLAAVHDYIAWNEARWKIIDSFTARKIDYDNVDGGFEYNGFFFYEERMSSESWWWVKDNEYLIAFGPVKGFDIYETVGYDRWLKFRKENIFLLKKNDAP